MYGIAFEWDRENDSANRRKPGIGFAEASTVFGDPLSITIPDPDHGLKEGRFLIVGVSLNRNLLVVVHTVRGEAHPYNQRTFQTKHEKRNYEESSF